MSEYVATFYTHLAAMRTCRALLAQGASARMEPVPRALSASCGTCVRYQAEEPCAACFHMDWEALYRCENERYTLECRHDAAL